MEALIDRWSSSALVLIEGIFSQLIGILVEPEAET